MFLARHGSFWGFFTFNSEKERLDVAANKAKHELQLLRLLQHLHLDAYYTKLLSEGVHSVESLTEHLRSDMLREIIEDGDVTKLQEAAEKPQHQSSHREGFRPFKSIVALFSFSWWSIKFIVGEFFIQVLSVNILRLSVE